MKLISMDFGNDENPSSVKVDIPIDEVATLLRILGRIVPTTQATSDMYYTLSNAVERFHDDGVDDIIKERGLEFPDWNIKN